ncbi:MAG TPA: hypothetical protein VHD56_18305 [Tepidisphaeraceae bacterium]|nr:hypothetical protein [Tepidisphaeraceae bacterium]
MKLLQLLDERFQIQVTRADLRILLASMGHITPIIGSDEDFRIRFSCDKLDARRLSEKIGLILNSMESDTFVVVLSKHEALILVNAMSHVANGTRIYDWEFQTIVGALRIDVRSLLEQIHHLLVNSPKDLQKALE